MISFEMSTANNQTQQNTNGFTRTMLQPVPPLKLIFGDQPLTKGILRVPVTPEELLARIKRAEFQGKQVFCAIDVEATGPIGHSKCRILAVGFAFHVLGSNLIYTFSISIHDGERFSAARDAWLSENPGAGPDAFLEQYRAQIYQSLERYHATAEADEKSALSQLSQDLSVYCLSSPEDFADKPGDSWWSFLVERNPLAYATMLTNSIPYEEARQTVLSIFTAFDANCAKLRLVSDNPSYDLVLFREFFAPEAFVGKLYDPVTYQIDTETAKAEGRTPYYFTDPAWYHTRGPVWCPDSFMAAHKPFSSWVSTEGYFRDLKLEIHQEKSQQHVPDTDAENMMRSFIGCYQVACLREQQLDKDFEETYPELAQKHFQYMEAAWELVNKAMAYLNEIQ